MNRFRSAALVGLSVALLCVTLDRARSHVSARLYKLKDETDVYALPPPEYLERIGLGYNDAMVSILWASTLYQYGARVGKNARFPFATQYIRTITHLSPSFRPAYKFVSTFVTMQTVTATPEEVRIVRDILKAGTLDLPDDADVWGAFAVFLMYEGSPYLSAEEKSAWRVEGAVAAQRAVELGYVAENIAIAGAIQLEKAGHRDLAISQLQRSYAMAPTDEAREAIGRRLDRLKGKAAVEQVERTRRVIVERQRREAPFATEATVVLVGPRRRVAACAGLAGEVLACADGWAGALAEAKQSN